jgi:hypothetical protein
MPSRRLLTLVAAAALVACGQDTAQLDDALRQDLSLAGQPYMPQQFMSPLEAGYAPNGYYPQPGNPQAPYGYQPAVARSAPTIRRAPAAARSTGVYAAGSAGRVVKNTKRDAAIGAVAGAAIGAVVASKKDRVRNAVLGAAAGAVLGGVIGNNVDLKRIP